MSGSAKGSKIERSAIVDALRRSRHQVVTLDALLVMLTRAGGRGRSRGARKALLAHLRRLVREGEVERVIGGYRLARADGLVEGEVQQVDAKGEAVVIDARDHPWTVATYDDVQPGARVLVAPTDFEASRGSLVQRLDAPGDHWVGIVRAGGRREPCLVAYRGRDRFRVAIAHRDLGGARDGEVVVAEAVEGKRRKRGGPVAPRGRVVERLGRPGDPEADFRAIVFNHRLPVDFSAQALAEADAAAREGERIDSRILEARLDQREQPYLTIDPATARDHDDAVFVEAGRGSDDALTLWVAIADVSHFVQPGSALDREALRRGNSVYFCDRAVPMLPEPISNDLCSLRAGTDRLAVAVSMQVLRDGRVKGARFHAAVIRVRENLSYEAVADTIEGRSEASAEFDEEVQAQLEALSEIERRLGRRRFEQGSIDFDLPESEVVLDSEGQPTAIERRERTRAHRAIEEAMLAANRAVAQWLIGGDRGAIFRAHDPPAPDRLDELREELARFDLLDRGQQGPLDSKQIHRALKRARGRPIAERVNMLALRSMTQARYYEDNRGHFALGFEAYLHFTSPIRRYADLVVHRVVKHAIASDRYELDRHTASAEARAQISRFISQRERVAIQAERDSLDLKKCVFMRDHVGESFSGHVTGVATHGLYITLVEHDVTGLVPSAALGFGLELDERAQAIRVRRSGARYALGDALEVGVEDVNVERGWIRFQLLRDGEPVEEPRDERRGKGERGKKGDRLRKGRRAGRKARRKPSPNRGRGRR